jgi:dihydropteroate synthase
VLVSPATSLELPFPCILGIVNVTPDSFSDGGRFLAPEDALAQGLRLVREGAALVDIGGESTRPGSDAVTVNEELRRVLPVVEALAESVGVPISVDTTKAEVARRSLLAGASLINDVTALRGDAAMVEVVAEAGCPVCLMHMQGEPKTMQDDPHYDDVVDDVLRFLEERMAFALAHGVREEQILLDPGIGFGKTVEHNLTLLRHLDRLVGLGRPVVLGASRKRFLGAVLGTEPGQRVIGTVATTVVGLLAGVHVFRVHDVKPNFEALRVGLAIIEGPALS